MRVNPLLKKLALVHPVIQHGRTKINLSTTRHKRSSHHSKVLVTIDVDGEEYTLELRLNHGLLPEGHIISYQDQDKIVLHRPKREELELCQYTGHVRGKHNSWVAVSTCHGLRGVIHDGAKIRYIEPAEEQNIQSAHYIYENSEFKRHGKCGYVEGVKKANNNQLMKIHGNRSSRHKRSFIQRGFFGNNERSRYVELVLVADHAQYLGARRDLRALHHQLQETTNIVNAVFAPHNVFIALIGIEVWTVEDRIPLDPNSQVTLDHFLEYLPVLLKSVGRYDHAQLMTDTPFDKSHVGLAYVGSMCSSGSCAVIYRSGYNVSVATIVKNAYNIAHELGHSFGMRHDTEDCECRDNFCIMSEQEQTHLPTHWSDCSLRVLDEDYSDGNFSSCLRNKPVHLFGNPSCGNSFLDPGEDCDCGINVDDKINACQACCHPETCKLRSNATCIRGDCCDIQMCQFKSMGTLCRVAELECDLPEYCNGLSEYCPEDVFTLDAIPCSGQLCVTKYCLPVDYQRQTIIRQHSNGCLTNCSGHGVCNSKGHCHCDDGFAPPMCNLPGGGGSEDSGPANRAVLPSQFELKAPPHQGRRNHTTPTTLFELDQINVGAFERSPYYSKPYSCCEVHNYINFIGIVVVILGMMFLIYHIMKLRIIAQFGQKENLESPSSTGCLRHASIKKVVATKILTNKLTLPNTEHNRYHLPLQYQKVAWI
ncbi:zinc metalloproteinase/disintegrin isoform X2 [Amyelois transitella]|uniref:zinc metalloproteinase/disintegrin isoform X2 n=1 Tax=Amyelois transitella TaxID=680683 RepID=UPI00298F810A|nr:zinc metalloproteinase/disintegrin isoform X2 [Amyelois transitella]